MSNHPLFFYVIFVSMNKKHFTGGEVNTLDRLIQKDYADSWIHFSNNDDFEFRTLRQTSHYGFKPKGMWLAKGIGWLEQINYMTTDRDDFLDWIGKYKTAWEIKINKDKLIILKGKDDYLTFTNKYGKGKNAIDWLRVAEDYAGIYAVAPYYRDDVLNWTFGWDLTSVCIWSEEGFTEYNKIFTGTKFRDGGEINETLIDIKDDLKKEAWETEDVCFIGKPDYKREAKGKLYQEEGYKMRQKDCVSKGVQYLLAGEYPNVAKWLFEISIPMWNFYNYMNRYNISRQDCITWINEVQDYFNSEHTEVAHRDFCEGYFAWDKLAECKYNDVYRKELSINSTISIPKGEEYESENLLPLPIAFFSTYERFANAPKSKRGSRQDRSYMQYLYTKDKRTIEDNLNLRIGEDGFYKGFYWSTSINLVDNYKRGAGWGNYFKEIKTGLLFPQWRDDEESFHFNTLLHEMAHIIDLQFQIKAVPQKDLGSGQGDGLWSPLTIHEQRFLDALYRLCKASSNGSIPFTQTIEYKGRLIYNQLKGDLGDLILADRVAKAEARKSLIKSEQVQSGERFSWNISWNKDLKKYIEENEIELTRRKKQLSITEALNLHYLLDKFKNTKLLNYIRNNPKKSKAIKTALDDSITESTRLLNNLYENMQNNFEYGLEPKTEQEQDIVNRCKGEKSLDEFVRCAYTKYAKGGKITTWKNKYNKKYGYKPNKAHNLSAISKDTGISKKGLQQIYNKGVGAYKTNPSSVRPNVKSKEQWAMARVYSAVMGGKASKIDKKELQMK